MVEARPFVKWAGGKQQLLNRLAPYFPLKFGTYYEPFVGGGAVFFFLRKQRGSFPAVLNDANVELINAYQTVQLNVEKLIKALLVHEKKYLEDPKGYYYRVRAEVPADTVLHAARLIFLNHTCYNGLYRVNSLGKFNVPFGGYKKPRICDAENLVAVSKALEGVVLKAVDFREVLLEPIEGDFVYIDPPYVPLSETAKFTSYTVGGFSDNDQKDLARLVEMLDSLGCTFVLSNSDTEIVRSLYACFSIERVSALRAISSRASSRVGCSELIISNLPRKV